MAMVSAHLPGVPQTKPTIHPSLAVSSRYTDNAADVSPTFQQERSFYYQHARPQQIRPQKSPLYVPAVYRPTERPVRQPVTPPAGAETSFDLSRSPAAQRAAGEASGLARIVTDEWNEAALGKVTGLPTKNHWKTLPDAEECMAAILAFETSEAQNDVGDRKGDEDQQHQLPQQRRFSQASGSRHTEPDP
ncbi:MAG: hypothetical protein Q9165_006683 [Trypethelium subeluteriae]